MLDKDMFPQGIAFGDNFCNRVYQREVLSSNIASCRPTLIMSPRRYGKTSLVLFVLAGTKLPFARIDLYSDLNEVEMQNSILNAIGDILYSIEKGPKKAMAFVMEFFSDLNVSFKYSGKRVQIELTRSKKSPAKIILESLKKLDQVLKSKKLKSVLFFDEFQRVSQITESHATEASLRSIAQESKNIMFIFSGSNRNILCNLFDDNTKPLYKLCDRIALDRIEDKDYLPFIEKKFSTLWNDRVSAVVIERILELTERHPYYVNVLCHKLSFSKKSPSSDEVNELWHNYAIAEKSNVTADIDKLSANQAKLLISISKYGDETLPMTKEFLGLTGFSHSSASQSLKVLEKQDYIQIDDNNKYIVVDPLIKYIYFNKLTAST